MLSNREEETQVETLQHTTLATTRLKFLFLAARIWKHAGRTGVTYSDHYAEARLFQRFMERLRSVASNASAFVPVIPVPLRYTEPAHKILCTCAAAPSTTYKREEKQLR